MSRPHFVRIFLLSGLLGLFAGCGRPAYHLNDATLKIVPIDSDRHESYLGLAVDGAGRIFVGGREALFVYEPKSGGGYHRRRELYRFPPDTWIYDLAVRGHDLYALTASALYVFRNGAIRRDGLQPEKILRGFPTLHLHQCLHGLTFGPDGDLYVSWGDPVFYLVEFTTDHWAYWNFHHGSDDAISPFVGTGGVLRLSPDGRDLAFIATGTRNVCGIAFDSQWNLFGGDNDQETQPDEFVPGRLLYFTQDAFFNWPRGWMTEKQPWRSDLLQTMSPNLGRYVPVGDCFYDDDFLPSEYRHCLYVARWGTRSIPRCSLAFDGDACRAVEHPFLIGAEQGNARPVNVTVGRDGRLFAITCYMEHNDASPIYKSDLFMITRQDDPAAAPFHPFDPTQASLADLFERLKSPSWSLRFQAHLELTRRGPEAFAAAAQRLRNFDPQSPAAPSLIWLAAAGGPDGRAEVRALTKAASPVIRLTALRALTRFSHDGGSPDVFSRALDDADARVRHAGLIGLLERSKNPPLDKVAALGAATLSEIVSNGWRLLPAHPEDMDSAAWQTAGQSPHWETGSYERQTAAMILAKNATVPQLTAWCEDADPARRLMGVLGIGLRMTLPARDQKPNRWIPMPSVLHDGTNYFGPDAFAGHAADAPWCAAAGVFTTENIWMALTLTDDDLKMIALLEHRLQDANKNVARQSLFFLRLIRRRRSDEILARDLDLTRHFRRRAPLTRYRVATATNLPPAFRGWNWPAEAAKGDPVRGRALFQERGCDRCHSIAQGDRGSGGPSLAAAGARFNTAYLAESILAPNAVVSPLFRWTALHLTDGSEIDGLVVGETPDDVTVLLPSTQRQIVRKHDIVSRQIQNRSPMPEGLITTPQDLRDVLAFLNGLR